MGTSAHVPAQKQGTSPVDTTTAMLNSILCPEAHGKAWECVMAKITFSLMEMFTFSLVENVALVVQKERKTCAERCVLAATAHPRTHRSV
jgi:hypothetical protein